MTARLGLRARLAIWFGGSILLILAPFIAGILVLEWRSMRASLDHHLTEDFEVAREMLVLRGPELAWRVDGEHDVGYDAGVQRWVEVYGEDGRRLFVRGVAKQLARLGALPPSTLTTRRFQTVRTPAGAHVRVLAAPTRIGASRVSLRVARSEDALRADLQNLIVIFSIGMPLAVLSAALAGYLISGRALAPLARMADRARSISADHLSQRLPVENPDDELGRLAVVFNETFANLERSFQRLTRFTSDASHQLRTPLTAIRSVGEVGLRQARDSDGYREVIGSMLEETDRLSRLIDTLLTLSRWDSGRAQPSPEPVDLGVLVRDTIGQLAILAEERAIRLEVDMASSLHARVDPVMVRQALMNVLDNAIKFTREGGTVRVHTRSDPRRHEILVDDQGPGIPKNERERVFERFYRVGGDRAPSSGGSGLGLAIAHWAMTANSGAISIEGHPAGARVVLSLPRET